MDELEDLLLEYCKADVEATMEVYNQMKKHKRQRILKKVAQIFVLVALLVFIMFIATK